MKEIIIKQDVLDEIVRFSTEEGSSVECQQLYCDVNNMPSIFFNKTNGEIVQALFPNIDKGFSNVIDLNLWWNAKYKAESDHKCHNCKHYTSGQRDGSCGSYICKHYSGWESEG